jgi:hypothetical protein
VAPQGLHSGPSRSHISHHEFTNETDNARSPEHRLCNRKLNNPLIHTSHLDSAAPRVAGYEVARSGTDRSVRAWPSPSAAKQTSSTPSTTARTPTPRPGRCRYPPPAGNETLRHLPHKE